MWLLGGCWQRIEEVVMGRGRIGLREVRALQPSEIAWDGAVAGFGARRQTGDVVSYFLKYRTVDGRQRWLTIGRHGSPWTPDTARNRAKELLGEVVGGTDPSAIKTGLRKIPTVAHLCDLYFEDALAGRVRTRTKSPKKATTLAIDRGRIDRHIKPLIGAMNVTTVTRHDVEKLLHDIADGRSAGRIKTKARGLARVSGGETAANRAVGLLGAIFTYAIRKEMRADNPVRGVTLFADRKKDRRLTDDEYRRFGVALEKARGVVWPSAITVARFMALTGFRRGEVIALRWGEVDLARCTIALADTKTGRSIRPLSRAACELLSDLSRNGDLVFPAARGDGPMTGFPKLWARMVKLGALPADITPHVLRHSFASVASDAGYSEATIAAMMGHKGRTMTSRYVHSADAVLVTAADAVANRIAALMKGEVADGVVELESERMKKLRANL
jgi:integrase